MKTLENIRRILREDSNTDKITKIAVFDFDGTLANTPEADSGKEEYKMKTGQDWPYKGWWGRAESLDTNIFDIEAKPEVVAAYKKERSNPDTLVIMLTGRIQKLSKQVEDILNANGLKFDYYFYNDGGSTLEFKINTMEKLLSQYPDVKSIEMWDDRTEHIEPFKAWGSTLKNIDFNINHVK